MTTYSLDQFLGGRSDVSVTGNIVHKNGDHGILINGAQGKRILASGNVCTGNGVNGAGIGLVCGRSGSTEPPPQTVIAGNTVLDNSEQVRVDGADCPFIGNLTGGTGVGAAPVGTGRYSTPDTIFGQHWRMFGDATGLFVENINTRQRFSVQLAPLANQ